MMWVQRFRIFKVKVREIILLLSLIEKGRMIGIAEATRRFS